jgi:IS1 family transposase
MTLDLQKAEMCLRLLLEGCSIRSVERVTGVHRDTIIRLLVKAGERCERLLCERIRGLEVDEVQADEIWGFVGMKEKRRPEDREDLGDAWAFVAFERKTKMVLCYHLGKRTMADTQIFTDRLADATRGNFQITTDGFAPYIKAIDESLGHRVSFAQLIKVYRASAEAERRYSPPECVEAVPVERIGMPVKEKIPRRTEQPHDTDAPEEADQADQRLQQEVGQPSRGPSSVLRVVQLLQDSRHNQGYACDGSWDHKSCVDVRGSAGVYLRATTMARITNPIGITHFSI